MIREKYNLIQELQRRSDKLKGNQKLALHGQGDFAGSNNLVRSAMNNKHISQHLAIDNPEFPMIYDGKENIKGKYSSFYFKADKNYEVIEVCKKYDELLNGKSYVALYFLHCKEDDSYKVVHRKEVEDLTENFGFQYNNSFLDNVSKGDKIDKDTIVYTSSSYDENMNVGVGINGRILYAVHPAVQDDAIIISESFAKRGIINDVRRITIPISESTILLDLWGKDGEYQGLPNIGDIINNGIVAATRAIRESRMFSDMRDISLHNINTQSDHVYYGDGEIIDINIYSNMKELKSNKVNKQLLQYYNDAKWFYTKVYKTCKAIVKSGSTKIDKEIHRWMRLAMNYLDTNAVWAFNDNVFSGMMVEILIRRKECMNIGRKIVGRSGNKTVICSIWKDEEMPYLTEECYTDEYGVVHGKGPRERVDLITNPLAIINRTIPMVMYEGSETFILDKTRKAMAKMDNIDDQHDLMFDVLGKLNPKETKNLSKVYDSLSPYAKKQFIKDSISVGPDHLLQTNNGLYSKWEAFNDEWSLRDAIIDLYEKYPDMLKPYHIFMPKPKWGRDIYIGDDFVGYQYIMVLKQSGDKGFSIRSSGAISDESLPEKDNSAKTSRSPFSTKPIRFGEYETPNFMIVCDPNDFALITALYRSSVDGRRFMYEAILSQDGEYNIPDTFTSRTAEILQVYLKSLGVKMETIDDENNFIGEPEHETEIITFAVGDDQIQCTTEQMYYLRKINKVYQQWIKENPNLVEEPEEVWDYILDNLPFKRKYLTDEIMDIFRNHLQAFYIAGKDL